MGHRDRHVSPTTTPPDRSELNATAAPEDADKLGAWLRDGAGALVDAIRAADPRTPVWSWADDHSVGFWARRMAHETAVHRADAELALGREFTLEADLAADAISEWLGFLSLPQAVEHRPELAELRGDRARFCTCIPPIRGSARRGSGSCAGRRRVRSGNTATPKAMSRCGAQWSPCYW